MTHRHTLLSPRPWARSANPRAARPALRAATLPRAAAVAQACVLACASAGALLLPAGGAAAAGSGYYRAQAVAELQPQGPPFGHGWTMGFALNDSGVVVGNTQTVSAVRWSFAEGLKNLGSPARAFGIANSGTAVGYLDLGAADGVIPVRWSPTSGFAPLSDLYAGAPAKGIAWAVNDQDWVLASDLTAGANNGLLLLRPGQAALNLGPVGGGDIRFNPMVNAGGMVAGTTGLGGAGGATTQGFIWTQAGGARTFDALAGGRTLLGGLNDNGLVVGVTDTAGGSIFDGFVYDANTGTMLQALPGFTPTDINNAGAIVGIQFGSGGPQNSSAAQWRNGAIVNLNGFTADLGVYHLTHAVDINASGQILAFGVVDPAVAGTGYTGPALRSFVLSECARCGQIRANPNPTSTLLDVGPDWFDAYNAEDYRNEGTLQVRTTLVNAPGAVLRNGGDIEVLAPAGRLFNTGSLDNGPGGRIIVSGVFDTGGSGGVINRAAVRVLEGGSMYLAGSEGFINRSLARFTQVGGLVRNDALFSADEALFDQPGGSFENLAGGTFRLWGGDAVVGASFTNAGSVLMAPDPLAPIAGPLRQSQMRITGTLLNQLGATFSAEDRSLIEIAGGQLVNRGAMKLEPGAARLTLTAGGSLVNDGGTLRLGAGSRLALADDAGSLDVNAGHVYVDHGARLEIGATVAMNLYGGRLSNEGVVVVGPGGHITNSGNVHLQAGSRLELDGGASFEQGAGELMVAAGAQILGAGMLQQSGGTTTVNGAVSLPLSVFHGGVLAGSGSFSGNVALGGAIDLRPGNSPGTLRFDGDLALDEVRLTLELESYRRFDRIEVGGLLTIGQLTVTLAPTAGYEPDLNDSFAWLGAASVAGNAPIFELGALPAGWRGVPDAAGAAGVLALWNDAAVPLAPSPNPADALLSVAAGSWAYHAGDAAFINAGALEVGGALAIRPGAVFVQLSGASLVVLPGGRLSNRGTLGGDGAIVNAGTLVNYADGEIDASGAAGLVNRGRLTNDGALRVRQRLENEAGGLLQNNGSLTVFNGAQLINRGRFEHHGQLANDGLILNLQDAEFIVADGAAVDSGAFGLGEYRDNGGITRVDGRLQASRLQLWGTRLRGHGTLAGAVELGGAEVMPEVGTALVVDGNLSGSATFIVGWQGSGLYGRLQVNGDLTLAPGLVQFVLPEGGYLPQAGDRVEWLQVAGLAQGLDQLDWRISVQTAGAACAQCELYAWTPPADLKVSFDGGVLSVQAVPEPQRWALLTLGLATLMRLARRRQPPAE